MGDAITDESIQGFEHLKKVFAAFEKLDPVGTERDTAKNRMLFYSQFDPAQHVQSGHPVRARIVGCFGAEEPRWVRRLKLTEKSRRKNDEAYFSVLIFLSKSPGRNWSE